MLDTSNAHKTHQTGVRLHLRLLSDACADRRHRAVPSRTTVQLQIRTPESLSLLHSQRVNPGSELFGWILEMQLLTICLDNATVEQRLKMLGKYGNKISL